jgi:hypothetical protein
MFEIPDKKDLKLITKYEPLDQLEILRDIGNRIYIARHISLSQEEILDNLEKIDKLFNFRENHN